MPTRFLDFPIFPTYTIIRIYTIITQVRVGSIYATKKLLAHNINKWSTENSDSAESIKDSDRIRVINNYFKKWQILSK